MVNLRRYRRTSTKNGGQYSGPCYFYGYGRDRFTIEPHFAGGPRWFCRKCSTTCQKGFDGGNYRYGMFLDEGEKIMAAVTVAPTKATDIPMPTYEDAVSYAGMMTKDGLDYLSGRGISAQTVTEFKLGMCANCTAITIPLIYELRGEKKCPAIKYRFLPEHRRPDQPKYLSIRGSKTKGIFNFDILEYGKHKEIFGVIANSVFDIMLIHQYMYPVVGPFAGENSWEDKWAKYFNWEYIINLGDRDEPDDQGKLPGEQYMLRRAMKLFHSRATTIINYMMPEPYRDMTDAWQKGARVCDIIDDALISGTKFAPVQK